MYRISRLSFLASSAPMRGGTIMTMLLIVFPETSHTEKYHLLYIVIVVV